MDSGTSNFVSESRALVEMKQHSSLCDHGTVDAQLIDKDLTSFATLSAALCSPLAQHNTIRYFQADAKIPNPLMHNEVSLLSFVSVHVLRHTLQNAS